MRFRRIARRQAAKPDDANPPITRGGLSVFRRLLGYVRPYWRWMTVAVVALIISSLLGLVLPLVVRNLVDFAFVNDDVADLNRVTLGLLAVFIFQSLFTFIQQMALANAGERAVADIRIDVFTPVSYTHLDVYKRQQPNCQRAGPDAMVNLGGVHRVCDAGARQAPFRPPSKYGE